MKPVLMISLLVLLTAAEARAQQVGRYEETIRKTAAMVSDPVARRLAQSKGLSILNVTWEDTGRYKGSSVGPNISDMTIQVQRPTQQGYELTCMPVIRFDNFNDKSADISPDKFFLTVGNERGAPVKTVSLREYLRSPGAYMTVPGSWKGGPKSLLAKRDTHVLVSAQACFLPVPKEGMAEFNPVIFNYQSYEKNPAVLTILATREGTSMTVIDNKRDAFPSGGSWGQRLFFNKKGERAVFTGQRLSDFKGDRKQGTSAAVSAAGESALNLVLLIQVPLKFKEPRRSWSTPLPTSVMKSAEVEFGASDVEEAVIGHGRVEGPFTEVDGLKIERDERFPVRVTVQFYKATSNGVMSENDIAGIRAQIDRVYADADYVGSLVTGGETGRPTEYEGPGTHGRAASKASDQPKFQPPTWWEDFWKRHQSNTGLTPEETIRHYRRITGGTWNPGAEDSFRKDVDALERERASGKGAK